MHRLLFPFVSGPAAPPRLIRRTLPAVVLVLLSSPPVVAHVLHLKNGNRIVVDRFWEEGDQILYERNGGVFGFPRSLLARVERSKPRSTPAA
ncbi:MAG: hypothetical protein ACE5JI_22335, partial [Acidobacteriota bacterium]